MRVKVTRDEDLHMTENIRPQISSEAWNAINALRLWSRLSQNPHSPSLAASHEKAYAHFTDAIVPVLKEALADYEEQCERADKLFSAVRSRISAASSLRIAGPKALNHDTTTTRTALSLIECTEGMNEVIKALRPT